MLKRGNKKCIAEIFPKLTLYVSEWERYHDGGGTQETSSTCEWVSEWVSAKWEVRGERERESEGEHKTSAVCTELLPSTIACLILSSMSL